MIDFPRQQAILYSCDCIRTLLPLWKTCEADYSKVKVESIIELIEFHIDLDQDKYKTIQVTLSLLISSMLVTHPNHMEEWILRSVLSCATISSGKDDQTEIFLNGALNSTTTQNTKKIKEKIKQLKANTQRKINNNWFSKDVISVGSSINKTRDFFAMPILADALEEAGCNDDKLLTSLRTSDVFGLSDALLYKIRGY